MITFIRKSSAPYKVEFGTADVALICNMEKPVPLTWITEDGSDIGEEFIAYAAPLLMGKVDVPLENGLPRFAYRK